MRKMILIILSAVLLSVFLSGQFENSSIWAKEKKKEKKEEEVKIPDKKPKGMSDIEWEKLKAKKPLPFDKGPSTIDVSKYPKEMQDIYKNVFTVKCSKCHTIARPINAPYALESEWKTYIKKMMKKPGSGINPSVAKKVFKFLVYDSKIRKKDAIARKLKEQKKKKK